jgi:hypothetical protein
LCDTIKHSSNRQTALFFQKEGLKIEKGLNKHVLFWQLTEETKKLRLPITNMLSVISYQLSVITYHGCTYRKLTGGKQLSACTKEKTLVKLHALFSATS